MYTKQLFAARCWPSIGGQAVVTLDFVDVVWITTPSLHAECR
jgi:hypothetical protein